MAGRTTSRGYGYREHQKPRERLLKTHRDGSPCPVCKLPMWRDRTRNHDQMALEADHEERLADQQSRRGHRPTRLLHGSCNRRIGNLAPDHETTGAAPTPGPPAERAPVFTWP